MSHRKPPPIKRVIAARIYLARRQLGLSRSALAIAVNITYSKISGIESHGECSAMTLRSIAVELGTTVERLSKPITVFVPLNA